jgi:hypothetical protein
MLDADEAYEMKCKNNLESMHESIASLVWDLDHFLDNRTMYAGIDNKKASFIDEHLWFIFRRLLADSKYVSWVASDRPLSDRVSTANLRGYNTFNE